MADTIKPPNLTPRAGGSGSGNWVSSHKGIVIGGVIVAGLGLYLYLKKRSSSSTTTTGTTTATASPEYVYPQSGTAGYGSGYGGGTSAVAQALNNQTTAYQKTLTAYATQSSNYASALTGVVTGFENFVNSAVSAANTSNTPQPNNSPPTNNGRTTSHPYNSSLAQTIGGTSYRLLGTTNSSGLYTGYNVKTGLPVLATQVGQGTPKAGFTLHAPGQTIWTPSTTPISDITFKGSFSSGQPL